MLLQDSLIEIQRLPINEAYGQCCIEIVSLDGHIEHQPDVFNTLPNYFRIPQSLKDGLYRLCIYLLSPYGENTYYGLFNGLKGIPFRKCGKAIEFIPSTILDFNQTFLTIQAKCMKNGELMNGLKPSYMIQSTDSDIQGLAIELTKNSADTIGKIKDIYFYVSRTLQYDNNALNKGSYCYTGQTASEALKYNKCVCQGFANLTVAMCRAIGIPSYSVLVYVKPDDYQWEDLGREYQQYCNPHQIALAWVNCLDRWVIMDPTWDNDQFYDANGYGSRYGNGLPYKYFDTTPGFISYTHRFVEIFEF